MAKRLEQGIVDHIINKKVLGKRKLGFPIKYNYETVLKKGKSRFNDALYLPRTKLDRLLSNLYERCLPGLRYFIWEEQIHWARYYGFTLSEKFNHSLRSAPWIQMHSLTELIHPWGYLELQRRDAHFRKVHVLMPGAQIPDWAQGNKKFPEWDYNSISNPQEAMNEIFKESTPAQHINTAPFMNLHHLLNERNVFGYPAQRLFYNEDLRGDYYLNGYLNKKDKQIIHGWYANSQADSQKDRIENLSDEERREYESNKERWDKNFQEFYPEMMNVVKLNRVMHKYDEAYFERNMNDIRSSIFSSKWVNALSKFTNEEIENIHNFFFKGDTTTFFTILGKEEEALPTDLYKKFCEELNFPNIMEIDRFTVYPPEKQFYDMMDKNWGINFDTVESYRNRYVELIKGNSNSDAANLVLEEVYNPVYRAFINVKYNYNLNQGESYVLKALENGVSKEELSDILSNAEEKLYITNSKVLDNMVNSQVRNLVKTFSWKGNL